MIIKSLKESWSFFKNHFIALSIIILPIVVPVEILSTLYQYFLTSDEFSFIDEIVPMVLNAVTYPIYTIAVIFYIASIITGEALNTKMLWKLGAKFWLPYIVMSTMMIVTVLSGFILLIIPGFILIIRYAFCEFDLLLNKNKPLDALKNSWRETKKYMSVILVGYVIITFALYAPYYLIVSLIDESSLVYWVLSPVTNIVYSVFAILYTIFAFRIYEHANLQYNKSHNLDAL